MSNGNDNTSNGNGTAGNSSTDSIIKPAQFVVIVAAAAAVGGAVGAAVGSLLGSG